MSIAEHFEYICKEAFFSPSMQRLAATNRAGYLKPITKTELPAVLGGPTHMSGGIRPTNIAPKVTQSFAPKPII